MSQNPGIGSNSGETQPVSTKVALTASAPDTATVTASSTEVVAANANRQGLVIVNITGNPVFLAFGANIAVLNNGIALTTMGSVYETSEYDFVTSAVNAISTVASNVISIQEFS